MDKEDLRKGIEFRVELILYIVLPKLNNPKSPWEIEVPKGSLLRITSKAPSIILSITLIKKHHIHLQTQVEKKL